MKFNEVKELIELINNSELSYFEMKNDKEFIKLDKSLTRNYVSNNLGENSLNKLNITDLKDNDKSVEDKESDLKNQDLQNNDEDFEIIASPIVGTFYEAMSPEDEPFVNIGQKISKGEVVCIVEAMKLMNEISSEFDCEIVDILGKNGKMVQYGDPLFKVRRV